MKKPIELILNLLTNQNQFVLYDIGAMGGIPKIWKPYEKFLKIIAFEPDDREFVKLNSIENVKYYNYALSDKIKNLDYNITKGRGKSSNLEPNHELLLKYPCSSDYEVQKKINLHYNKVTTLDILRSSGSVPDDIDFIKIDTQGSELSILKGGSDLVLDDVLGIQVEVEFKPLYKNQPLFRHIDEFLSKKNFELIDLKRYYWKRKDCINTKGKGEIIFGDALYFKNLEKFQEHIPKLEIGKARNKILKYIFLSLVYGINDYTISIIKIAINNHIFNENEISLFNEIICSLENEIKFRRTIKGISRMIIILFYLQKFLNHFSSIPWASSDIEIGNVIDN